MKKFLLVATVLFSLSALFPEACLAFGTEGVTSEGAHGGPATWSIIPFAALLIMIATGPLFYALFWHKNYPVIAVGLATAVILYYIFALDNVHGPVHAFFEYFQFISLLSALYIASGGVLIKIDKEGKPWLNVLLLIIGAIISNIIGTTGASMLLIRPYIRLNKARIQPYHVVFFIFMVSNIGGSLTPIGDPPLFLGFLKGVPFAWTLTHNFVPWLVAIIIFAVIFFIVDSRNKVPNFLFEDEALRPKSGKISLEGKRSFIWLGIVIASVFLDPNVEGFEWLPSIHYDGQKFSFIRELIMLSVAFGSYKYGNQHAIKGNEFNFEPIREVAFIFIGIFGTMLPALELVATFAKSPEGAALIGHNTLYWGTGLISGFLDNAPTYLNFFTAALASQGGDIGVAADVVNFANGDGFENSVIQLTAISVAAVFFGAMTYIGNGPNFMVKSIAEQVGVTMPSFFGYILRYSIPVLLPVLFIIWLIFFAFV